MNITCPICGSGLADEPVETVYNGRTGFIFKCYMCGNEVFLTSIEYANIITHDVDKKEED